MTAPLAPSGSHTIPRQPPSEPDDPARLIARLATGQARWITGQVINTESGFHRR